MATRQQYDQLIAAFEDGGENTAAEMRAVLGVMASDIIALRAGGTASVPRFGAGKPSNSLGKDHDTYTDTTDGRVYQRLNGAYVFQYIAKGSDGAKPQAGVDYSTPRNGDNGTDGNTIFDKNYAPATADNALGKEGDQWFYTISLSSYERYAHINGSWRLVFRKAEGSTVTPPADTTAPNIAFTAPASGATVNPGQQLTLTSNATDNVAVTSVVFLNGSTGAVIGAANKNGNTYTLTYTVPTGQATGPLMLQTQASDAAGNVQVASVTLNVQPATLPKLSTPSGYQASATSSNAISAALSSVQNATAYVFELATDSGFSQNVQAATQAGTSKNWSGLTANTTYYTRVKAQASGYQDSDYATATATTQAAAAVLAAGLTLPNGNSTTVGSALAYEATANGGTAPYQLLIQATNDDTGVVTQVYSGAGASRSGTWSATAAGKYSLTNTVTDATGTSKISAVRTVTVTAPVTGTTASFTRQQIKANQSYFCDVNGEENSYAVTAIDVNGYTSFEADIQTWNSATYEPYLHWWVDGVWQAPLTITHGTNAYGSRIMTVRGTIPVNARKMRLRPGPAIFTAPDYMYRQFNIEALRFSGSGSSSVALEKIARQTSGVVFVGDSILCILSPTNSQQAVVQYMRDGMTGWDVIMNSASGSWMVKQNPTLTSVKQRAAGIVAALAGYSKKAVVIEDAYNAFGNGCPLADFKTYLAAFIDEIRRLDPTIRILMHEMFFAANENTDLGAGPASGFSQAKVELAAPRGNYVTMMPSPYSVFRNDRQEGDNVHPNVPTGIQKLADYYNTNVPASWSATVGTDVYVPPAVADKVLWKMDMRTNLLDTGPNAFPFTTVGGVSIDAAKGAAYFDGTGYLTRNLGVLDTFDYGYKITGQMWLGLANNDNYGITQASGAYGLTTQQVSAGQGNVGFEAQRAANLAEAASFVVLKSESLAVAGAWVTFEVVWSRRQGKVKFTVAGQPPKVSDRLDQVVVPAGRQHVIGNGPGGRFIGWLRDMQCIALGSSANITESSTEGNTGGNTGGNTSGATVSSMSPTSGQENNQVTVSGSGLSGIKSAVFYNGRAGEIKQNTATQVVFLVPGGADTTTPRPIVLTLADGSVLNTPNFQVLPPTAKPQFLYDSGFDKPAGGAEAWTNLDPSCVVAGNGGAKYTNATNQFSAGKTLQQRAHGMAGSTQVTITVVIKDVVAPSTFLLVNDNGSVDYGSYLSNVTAGTYTFNAVMSQNPLLQVIATGSFTLDSISVEER